MNLILTRKERRADGVFSELSDEAGRVLFHTLEHAYPAGDGYEPKIPNGTFTCRRGEHRLHGMTESFSTFEITGVLGHQNLLFHWGNFNRDSEGCILVGEKVAQAGQEEMITNSRAAFARFLALQAGLDLFPLTVRG
jgi:hypothetical protein